MKDQGMGELTGLEKAGLPTGKIPGGIVLRQPGRGDGKRRRMVFEDRVSCYHVMSRVAGGELLFGETEKEAFRKMMWRMSRFSGVEVLTYAVMGNHFHLLIRVPLREKFIRRFRDAETEGQDFGGHDEEKLMEHLKLLYSEAYLAQLRAELELMKSLKTKAMAALYEKTIQGYYRRFCSMESFMKELKERYTRWFNKMHGRQGTLWQSRYQSVLVQDGAALRTMAAYIDLNPLRAGLVEDPKDYRWCGYAEAVGGSKRARRGLCRTLGIPIDDWDGDKNEKRDEKRDGKGKGREKKAEGRVLYRRLLLTDGLEQSREEMKKTGGGKVQRVRVKTRHGFDRKKALTELEQGTMLSRHDLVRCRVRYLSEGIAVGSEEFVKEAYESRQEWFSTRERGKEREFQKLPLKKSRLCCLRDLRGRMIE